LLPKFRNNHVAQLQLVLQVFNYLLLVLPIQQLGSALCWHEVTTLGTCRVNHLLSRIPGCLW